MNLYLVATPIGNLADFSLRAIETLQSCAYILCEDTRHSRVLLDRFQIHQPLKSFHAWNEKKSEDSVIADLKRGQAIALISDAGTPGICDPGEALVQRCWEEGIDVRMIPGPCAWISALALCPFDKKRIQFLGFIPKTESERKEALLDALLYQGCSLLYEAPHRVISSLEMIAKIDPKREVCLLRELTKLHEEHRKGNALQLLKHLENHPPRGEYVIVIDACPIDFSAFSPRSHVELLQKEFNLEKNEAIKLVASLQGVPKREVYRDLIHTE